MSTHFSHAPLARLLDTKNTLRINFGNTVIITQRGRARGVVLSRKQALAAREGQL